MGVVIERGQLRELRMLNLQLSTMNSQTLLTSQLIESYTQGFV